MGKIIVLGSTGLLGSNVSSYLSKSFECSLPGREFIRAENFDKDRFRTILEPSDVIINCIGILKHDISKYGKIITEKVNSVFPRQLSEICFENQCRMIHFSSDCVFSGKKGQYIETDPCDSMDIYGKTKSANPEKCSIIRTSFIGLNKNPSGQSLINFLAKKRNQEIRGFKNCLWNGVCCLELSKIIKKIIDKGIYWEGVRHIYSDQTLSKYQLCEMINQIYKFNIKIKPFEAEEISGSKVPDSGVLDRSLSSIFYNLNQKKITQQIREQYLFDE